MHPLDLLANSVICELYLFFFSVLMLLDKLFRKRALIEIFAVVMSFPFLCPVLLVLASTLSNFFPSRWYFVGLFALPVALAVCVFRYLKGPNRVTVAAVASVAALYFLECMRVTLRDCLYPPNPF